MIAIKLSGECDFSAQEIMDHITLLKISNLSFNVVCLSINESCNISIINDAVEGCCKEILQYYLIEFVAK